MLLCNFQVRFCFCKNIDIWAQPFQHYKLWLAQRAGMVCGTQLQPTVLVDAVAAQPSSYVSHCRSIADRTYLAAQSLLYRGLGRLDCISYPCMVSIAHMQTFNRAMLVFKRISRVI